MGIKKANTFYKSFTYNGTLASDYGVYVLDVNVFDAPKRAVDYYAIPGRNGDFALDNGRFENIEVVYTCGIDQPTAADFNTAITSFKNLLASTKGYCRLEDGINTGFYRMGVFSDGLEVKTKNQKSATFDVKFNCKPQRWLTSGETASTVANNGTLTNPTLFESSPLLAVKGYGGIHFNGFDVDIQNVTLGDVVIADGDSFGISKTYSFDKTLFNNGDSISVSGQFYTVVDGITINISSMTDSNASFSTNSTSNVSFVTTFTLNLSAGTNNTTTNTLSITETNTSPALTHTYTITQTVQYNASAGTITMSLSGTATTTDNTYPATVLALNGQKINIIGHSTASALGNPTYIDCDIGECYMIKNSNIVSLNGVIDLGSELPTLASGTNTFTYDNTITELKVTPRWWQV